MRMMLITPLNPPRCDSMVILAIIPGHHSAPVSFWLQASCTWSDGHAQTQDVDTHQLTTTVEGPILFVSHN